ncbi:MAG TPA: tyrosine-type recombinase/integrase [Trebonia sp.]|nr:tyrosine-type recombinase/integrase [Trebonia sp.]
MPPSTRTTRLSSPARAARRCGTATSTGALKAAGLEGVHLHNLRHTGNQLSADAGANLRELMERMGHDSTRAALIYLHTTAGRQRAIADQMGKNAKIALGKTRAKRSGTRMARGREST